MIEYDYKKIAIDELANKSLESTIYCCERLGRKKPFTMDDVKYVFRIADTEFVTVAFPISNKKVFLKVHVNTKNGNVEEVVIEAGNIVRLVALSKSYSLMEIENMTGLIPTEGWSKGDVRGRRAMDFTRFEIIPDTNMAEYPSFKLITLLDYLESKRAAVLQLIELSDESCISIVSWSYHDDMEGFDLPSSVINRISSFNLSLDFDPYFG